MGLPLAGRNRQQIAARAVIVFLTAAGLVQLLPSVAHGSTTVVEVAIAAGADDVEEKPRGKVAPGSSDLELTTDGTVVQTIGLRFVGVNVPRNANITAAWVQFRTDELSPGASSLTVRGHAADDAPAFVVVSKNVSSRTKTIASVPWTPDPWDKVGEAGLKQRTSDLSSIVAEITGRDGWNPGQAMAFIVTGTGRRTAEAFEGGYPPVLHVEYDTGGDPPPPPPTTVTFAAAADFGISPETTATIKSIDGSAAEFMLALGDLSYGDATTAQQWCDYVSSNLPTKGPEFPVEVLVGDAEDDGAIPHITDFAACFPDRLGSTLSPTNMYGAEYYFDYPATDPLMRAILIGADQNVNGVRYRYLKGNARYNWLAGVIDQARTAGIRWVVVGVHEVCLSAGKKACGIGADLMNLLFDRKVDLVLHGHDHNWQRSKQIALNPTTCASITPGTYVADCIVDDGADNAYAKGAGTVFVINGAIGANLSSVNLADTEVGYFAQLNSTTRGHTQVTLTADRMDVSFAVSAGSYSDAFSISG